MRQTCVAVNIRNVNDVGCAAVCQVGLGRLWKTLVTTLQFIGGQGQHRHHFLDGHGAVPPVMGIDAQVGKQLGKGEQRGLRHNGQWFSVGQLKHDGVVPQGHTTNEVARVCVHGAPMSNVVGGVGVLGAQDTLADDQRLVEFKSGVWGMVTAVES